jgi:hypothetical protein
MSDFREAYEKIQTEDEDGDVSRTFA